MSEKWKWTGEAIPEKETRQAFEDLLRWISSWFTLPNKLINVDINLRHDGGTMTIEWSREGAREEGAADG